MFGVCFVFNGIVKNVNLSIFVEFGQIIIHKYTTNTNRKYTNSIEKFPSM